MVDRVRFDGLGRVKLDVPEQLMEIVVLVQVHFRLVDDPDIFLIRLVDHSLYIKYDFPDALQTLHSREELTL